MKNPIPLKKKIPPASNEHFLSNDPTRDSSAVLLPIDIIKTSRNNIRSDLPNLEELAASIRSVGVLQNVIVAHVQGKFELIAGRRRLEAARLAGLNEVPARIFSEKGDGLGIIALVENIFRAQMDPIDEINTVSSLLEAFDGNQVELAQKLGKSKTYISRCVKAARMIRSCDIAILEKIKGMSKSFIFELADSNNPANILKIQTDGSTKSIRSAKACNNRESNRVDCKISTRLVSFRETRKGRIRLRIDFDSSKNQTSSIDELIVEIEGLLTKLKRATTLDDAHG